MTGASWQDQFVLKLCRVTRAAHVLFELFLMLFTHCCLHTSVVPPLTHKVQTLLGIPTVVVSMANYTGNCWITLPQMGTCGKLAQHATYLFATEGLPSVSNCWIGLEWSKISSNQLSNQAFNWSEHHLWNRIFNEIHEPLCNTVAYKCVYRTFSENFTHQSTCIVPLGTTFWPHFSGCNLGKQSEAQ